MKTHIPGTILGASLTALLTAFSGLLGIAPSISVVAQEPERDASEAASTASAPQESTVEEVSETRTLTGIWWNRPQLIERLGLSTEQRGRMDARLRASLTERRQLVKELREAQRKFGQLVTAKDKAAATRAADEVAEATAALSRFEGRLKIEVLAELTEAQATLVRERIPALVHRPWLRAAAFSRTRPRPR